MQQSDTKPNGPVAAAFLAGGIACLALGITVVIVAAFPPAQGQTSFFDFAKNYGIGSGVGPLSGKVILAGIAFVVAWVIGHLMLRGREVDFGRYFLASLALVAVGFLLTFPPVYDLFVPKAG